MKNLENIKKVLDHIKANPDNWDQRSWHCGTSRCFAGWAEIFATGESVDISKTRKVARIYFGFTMREADYYFDPKRTLEELMTATQPFYDEKGYGRDGYDHDGYDAEGYSRYGYDREGYDRDGYNCDGYNREGYNKYGYDRHGYDRDGYDIDGYDKYGYDREGYDSDGLDRNNNGCS